MQREIWRRKRLARTAVLFAALSAAPTLVRAQSFTWTTPTNASFSAGPWSPNAPSWGGGTSVGLIFINNIGAPYTATNDLGAPFTLNSLSFSAGDGRSITLANAPGNEFSFFADGASNPTINGTGSVSATLAGRTNIGTTTTVSGIATLNVTGAITGPGGFTFSGANQNVTISAANQNTGTTTINAGTISVANNLAFGSGSVVVGSGTLRNPNPGSTLPNIVSLNNRVALNGTLTYNAPGLADLTLNGSVGGIGGIVVSGAGSLRLTSNTNTFLGGVTFNSATTSFNARLIFSGNQGFGGGSANFIGMGTGELIFSGLNSNTIPLLSVQNTATAILAPAMDLSTLNIGNLSGGGTVSLGGFGSGGTVNLTGTANTNSGPLAFQSGAAKFSAIANLGSPSTLLFAGGTLLPTFNWTNTKPIVLSDYTAVNTPPLTTTNLWGQQQLDPAAFNDAIIKNGAGTMDVSIRSTTRFIVNAGTVTIASNTNDGMHYAGLLPALTVNAGGFFWDRSSLSQGTLPPGGGVALNGGLAAITGPETLGTLSLGTNTLNELSVVGSLTFAGMNYNSGAALLYDSSGPLGSAQFVRYTAAPSGSLLLGAGGAAGTATVSILAGSAAQQTGSIGFVTYDPASGVRQLAPSEYASTITSGDSTLNNASLNSSVTLSAPTTINSLNGGTIAGNTTLTINSGLISHANLSVATLAFPRPAVIFGGNISSVITGSSVTIDGSTLFSGNNQYTGATIIGFNTLTEGASEVIPDTSIVYINNSFGFPATWNINGNTETVAGISQQNVINSGASFGLIQLGAGTLIVGSGNASSSFAGNISGAGRLVKIGTGTLSLSGKSNTFSNGLTIRQGIVSADAMPLASSATGNANDFSGFVRDTISGDAVLGAGSIFLMSAPGNSAELRLGRGVTDLSRAIFVGTANGAGTCILSTDADPNRGTSASGGPNITSPITITNSSLQLSLSSGTLSGLISGTGSIVVNNNPVAGEDPLPIVTISSSVNSYTGTTSVINGSLYVQGQVSSGSPGALGSASSPINLGSSATTSYAELSFLSNSSSFQRNINVSPGQPGSTLALSSRSNSNNKFPGSISLGATALRVFGGANPVTGVVGAILLDGQITGSGSLSIGGGETRSTVWLNSATSNFSGGVTLTDGTLGVGTSSTITAGNFVSGPLGTGSFVIAGATLSPALFAPSRDVTLANALTVNSDFMVNGIHDFTFTGTAIFNGERVVTVNNPNLSFAGAVTTSGFLDKDGPGLLAISTSNTFSSGISVFAGTVQFGASQTLGALNIGGASRVNLTSGGNKVLRMNRLNIAGTGVLDLTDEDAIVDYTGASPLPRVAQLLTNAYNAGSWNGAGITSSTAQSVAANDLNPYKTTIGFGEASSLGIAGFAGQSVDSTAILFRYTFAGDANLDGNVNALDFNRLATSFAQSGQTWINGDFDYNGTVNSLDFNAIAVNFNSVFPGSALGSLVPEPVLAWMLGFMLLASELRRGRAVRSEAFGSTYLGSSFAQRAARQK
jgi:autotransporter-associated beta strand protein